MDVGRGGGRKGRGEEEREERREEREGGREGGGERERETVGSNYQRLDSGRRWREVKDAARGLHFICRQPWMTLL